MLTERKKVTSNCFNLKVSIHKQSISIRRIAILISILNYRDSFNTLGV